MYNRIKFSPTLIIVLVLLLSLNSFADNNRVIDSLDYLSSDEISRLNENIGRIQSEKNIDVVIVITDKLDGKTSMAYADDFYDENNYGFDSQYSGILMLINMKDREVWISTTGLCIDIFTDSRIETMIGGITDKLKNGDFYAASNVYLDYVANYANQGIPSGQQRVEQPSVYYGEELSYFDKVKGLATNPVVYLVSLLISLGITLLLSLNSKGKKTTNFQTYEESGSFNLSQKEDMYLREFVTKTKVVKNESSGGTSSTHSGSSGRSHGGGGGKF